MGNLDSTNRFLVGPELDELDSRVDDAISSSSLLSRPRSVALRELLLFFDIFLEGLGSENNLLKRSNLYSAAYWSLNNTVQWVYKYCPNTPDIGSDYSETEVFAEVCEIFRQATEYKDVWSQLSLVQRRRNRVERVNEGVLRITSAMIVDSEVEAARQLLRRAEDPLTPEEATDLSPEAYRYLTKRIVISKNSSEQFLYSPKPEAFSVVQSSLESRFINRWSMDPEWDLGGYSFQDLRDFWVALSVVKTVHIAAVSILTNESKRLAFRIKRKHTTEWTRELALHSKLKRSVVELIMKDLIFDPHLFREGEPKSHVLFHPFFDMGDGLLALSNAIVQISNIERNMWSLVQLLRPNLHADLRNKKEQYWTTQLEKKAQRLRLLCFSDIRFKHNGKPGNIDLLLIDLQDRFAILTELKWLTSTDDVKGTVSDDEKILRGVSQSLRSTEWVLENLPLVSQRIGLPLNQLREIEFRPLVLVKDNLLSGYVKKPDAPVANESLFNWILVAPHQKNLRTFWTVCESRSYLPKLHIHFKNISPEVEWGDTTFILENIASQPLKRWDPLTDIQFSDTLSQ